MTATLLEKVEVLTEVKLHMASQSSAASDFVSNISTLCTPALRSISEEEEDPYNKGAEPIQLAVFMESACWDLDFLVRLTVL